MQQQNDACCTIVGGYVTFYKYWGIATGTCLKVPVLFLNSSAVLRTILFDDSSEIVTELLISVCFKKIVVFSKTKITSNYLL